MHTYSVQTYTNLLIDKREKKSSIIPVGIVDKNALKQIWNRMIDRNVPVSISRVISLASFALTLLSLLLLLLLLLFHGAYLLLLLFHEILHAFLYCGDIK